MFAVQLRADIQTIPPAITLTWTPASDESLSYTIERKGKDETSWTHLETLPGTATSFTDSQVAEGAAYEYQVIRMAALGYASYGYIYAGIRAPLIENRGKLVLVVATNATAGLSNELARLTTDLTGDGWQVVRHNVSSNSSPASVRGLIVGEYQADPANVKAVFLLGHVPVLRTGNLDYDDHGARPLPADAFYGDVDGDWSGNPSFLPSDVELMVGRVDLFGMRGIGANPAWPNETELLRRYLNKSHDWRHGRINVPRRALIGDRREAEEGLATAASGYRNFAALVGTENIFAANVQNSAPNSQRWISMAAAQSYLLAYGCGAGGPSTISHLGTRGTYSDLWSIDMVSQDAKAVFTLFFGSWFGEWDSPDNFLRSVLVTPTMGLASCLAGQPHWYIHTMGLGEPIGHGARLSMNNSATYQNEINDFTRAVYVALMGDPTLRLHPVAPPVKHSDPVDVENPTFSWSASPDANLGYHVYRAVHSSGPFARLTSQPIATTSFTDSEPSGVASVYLVRALKLESSPSGTYTNASQGIFFFLSDTNTPPPPPPPPPDDGSNALFENRTVVSGTNVIAFGSNTGATKESGEPNHAGNTGGASVWWTWTAPESGNFRVSTAGSDFDTLLAVYTGDSLATLSLVAANDDGPASPASEVRFSAIEGVTYHIAVDGYNGGEGPDTGAIQLTITPVPPQFVPLNATYNGLISSSNNPAHESLGILTMKTTSKGTFSAKLVHGGKSSSFSGSFSETGAWFGMVQRKGASPINVSLQMDLQGGDVLSGEVNDGAGTADLRARRAVFSKFNPAPQTGRYTLVLPGSVDSSQAPGGSGFGTVSVSPLGIVKFAGVLGDGTKVSQGVTLSETGDWPFYVPLYSGNGSIAGQLKVDVESEDAISGPVDWFKPVQLQKSNYRSGFALQTEAVGSAYQFSKGARVLDLDEGRLALENGGLSEPVDHSIVLDANNRIANLTDSKSSVKITTASGLFKGKVIHPQTGQSIAVSGVILQSQNFGAGHFLNGDETGTVYLGP